MKKLRRTKGEERKVAGVCGGIAKYFGIDPTVVRVAFVLICIVLPMSIIAIVLAYAAMALLIPEETDYIDI